MSNLSSFLKQNRKDDKVIKYVASNSFVDEKGKPIAWEIRPLKSKDIESIRDASTKIVKNGKEVKFDNSKFNRMIAVACTVYPDLTNKELQDSYGVMDAEQLILELLDKAGEYQAYINKIFDISGYDKDMNELVEEAKN